jgi:F0F1-type ATP synthase delta subunit
MFTGLLTALVVELTRFLGKHSDFFDRKADAKEEAVKALKVPTSLKHYMAHVSAEHFLKDLRLAMQIINGADIHQLGLHGNAFFKAVVEFLTTSFAVKLDELPERFYMLPYEDRVEAAEKVIESDNAVAQSLRETVVVNSYQEIASAVEDFAKEVTGATTVLVQMPREISLELKKEMRQTLQAEHPYSFPIFQINRGLIGGFRLFVDGKTQDHSWFNRIVKITSYV